MVVTESWSKECSKCTLWAPPRHLFIIPCISNSLPRWLVESGILKSCAHNDRSLLFQLLLIAMLEKGKVIQFKNWFYKNLLQLLLWVCPENVLGQDHASPQKGKHVQLCPVWQIICKLLSYVEAQENPLWRKTFQVRIVQQVLHRIWISKKTSAKTHWGKAIQV